MGSIGSGVYPSSNSYIHSFIRAVQAGQGPWSHKLETEHFKKRDNILTTFVFPLASRVREHCGPAININNERDDFYHFENMQPPWVQPPSLQIDETLSYERLISFGHQAGVLTRQFLNANPIVVCSRGNFALFSSFFERIDWDAIPKDNDHNQLYWDVRYKVEVIICPSRKSWCMEPKAHYVAHSSTFTQYPLCTQYCTKWIESFQRKVKPSFCFEEVYRKLVRIDCLWQWHRLQLMNSHCTHMYTLLRIWKNRKI